MKQKSAPDPEMVLQKIRYFCSYQERCRKETEEKLKDWAVQRKLIPGILRDLEKEGFLSEERFAKVFAGGKFRQNKWGRQKIGFELKLRGIPEDLIKKGLSAIDEDAYRMALYDLIRRKEKEIKRGEQRNIREKIINFAHGKGFEMEIILTALKKLKI